MQELPLEYTIEAALVEPRKKKNVVNISKQERQAFTRMGEMSYGTKENLWSQFSTAQEHHTVVRADMLLQPVCMLIYVS